MIAQAEPTGSGLKAMTETGLMTLSFADEVGSGSLLITNAGCAPMQIPLTLDVCRHLSAVAAQTATNAQIAAEAQDGEPLVPRHAST